MFSLAFASTSLTEPSGSGGSGDVGTLIVIVIIVAGLALLMSSSPETIVVVERSGGFGWLVLVVLIGALYVIGKYSGVT